METLKLSRILLATNKLADGTDNDVDCSRFNTCCDPRFSCENKSHISECPVSQKVKQRGGIEGHCLNGKSIRDFPCAAYPPEGPEGRTETSAEHDEEDAYPPGRLLNGFKQGAATGRVVDAEAGAVAGGEKTASFDRSNLPLFRKNMRYGINPWPDSLALHQSKVPSPAIRASGYSHFDDSSQVFDCWIRKCDRVSQVLIRNANDGIGEVWSQLHATCQSRIDTFNEKTFENMMLVYRGFYKTISKPVVFRCFYCDNPISLNKEGRVGDDNISSNAMFGHHDKCKYGPMLRNFIFSLERNLALCYARANSRVFEGFPVIDLKMDSFSISDSQISSDDQSVLSADMASIDKAVAFGKVQVGEKGADRKLLEDLLALASTIGSNSICAVCKENEKVNVRIEPCKHLVFCKRCLWDFNENRGAKCPVCRVFIKEYDIAYYDS